MASCPTCGTPQTFVPRRGGWWCTQCLTAGDDDAGQAGAARDPGEDGGDDQTFQAAKLIWTLGFCGVGLAISGGLAIAGMPAAAGAVAVAAAVSVWLVRRRFTTASGD